MSIPKETADKFISWIKRKIQHHLQKDERVLYFHEGQIWWTALGYNIGTEINGKNIPFSRPVLILKKYNKHTCFILPLTTQIKDPKVWYQVILKEIENKTRAVNISQGRTISTKRLLKKQNSIKKPQLVNIKKKFLRQFE